MESVSEISGPDRTSRNRSVKRTSPVAGDAKRRGRVAQHKQLEDGPQALVMRPKQRLLVGKHARTRTGTRTRTDAQKSTQESVQRFEVRRDDGATAKKVHNTCDERSK